MTKRQKYLKEYWVKYYAVHREERRKEAAEYRVAHREELAERQHKLRTAPEWRAAHRKEAAEYRKAHCKEAAEYRAAHRKEIASKAAKYRVAHRKECVKNNAKYRAAHRVENIWRLMHLRAENKDGIHPTYANIHVCRRWSGPKGKENFVKDMGPRPVGTSLSHASVTSGTIHLVTVHGILAHSKQRKQQRKDSSRKGFNAMILQTATGQALPTAITLPSDGDGLALYAVDDNGVPVKSYFILTPAGAHNTNPKGVVFYGGKNSSMFIGTLDGFTSPTVVPLITVGPAFSTQYFPPDQSLIDGVVYCTIIAVPVSGGPSRQLQITVQETNNKVF